MTARGRNRDTRGPEPAGPVEIPGAGAAVLYHAYRRPDRSGRSSHLAEQPRMAAPGGDNGMEIAPACIIYVQSFVFLL
jgi:hypothetical protein